MSIYQNNTVRGKVMSKEMGWPWMRDDEAVVDDVVRGAVTECRERFSAVMQAYGVKPGVAEVGLFFSELTGDQHVVYVSERNGSLTLYNEDQIAEWEMRGLDLRGLYGEEVQEGKEKEPATPEASWYVKAARRLIQWHGAKHGKGVIFCTCGPDDLADRLEDFCSLLLQLDGVLIAATTREDKSTK